MASKTRVNLDICWRMVLSCGSPINFQQITNAYNEECGTNFGRVTVMQFIKRHGLDKKLEDLSAMRTPLTPAVQQMMDRMAAKIKFDDLSDTALVIATFNAALYSYAAGLIEQSAELKVKTVDEAVTLLAALERAMTVSIEARRDLARLYIETKDPTGKVDKAAEEAGYAKADNNVLNIKQKVHDMANGK